MPAARAQAPALPSGSLSRTATSRPRAARIAAAYIVVRVLPTPPLRDSTEMTSVMKER